MIVAPLANVQNRGSIAPKELPENRVIEFEFEFNGEVRGASSEASKRNARPFGDHVGRRRIAMRNRPIHRVAVECAVTAYGP